MLKAVLSILFCSVLGAMFGADVVSTWGGARGTIVLKSDGTVWTWGANFGGKLGIGDSTTNRALVPVEVHGAGNVDYLHSVSAIMGGEVHNVALKSDGTVWAWGNNFQGRSGRRHHERFGAPDSNRIEFRSATHECRQPRRSDLFQPGGQIGWNGLGLGNGDFRPDGKWRGH